MTSLALARLVRAVDDARLDDVRLWFDQVDHDGPEWAEARAWFRDRWRAVRRAHAHNDGLTDPADMRRHWDDDPRIHWTLSLRLMGPATAVEAIDWTRSWGLRQDGAAWVDELRRLIEARGEAWLTSFVAAASDVRLGKRDLSWHASGIFGLLAPLVLEHGLPVPDGHVFVTGWIQDQGGFQGDAEEILERWRHDPLMPDILHHALGSGETFYLAAMIPEAVRTLVDEGRLDRTRLLEDSFEVLTGQVRAGTAKLLAAVLSSLRVTRRDVTGGLPMMQDLISSCHGSVVAVLLPLAIEALESQDDVVELAATIAARPEKAPKRTLLSALADSSTLGRLRRDAVVAGLEVLAADREDAGFAAQVDAVAVRLGADVSLEEPAPTGAGLWDLEPARPTEGPNPWHRPRYGYDGLISPHYPYATQMPRPGSCSPDLLTWHVLSRKPLGAPGYDVLLRQSINTVYDPTSYGRSAATCLLWLVALGDFDAADLRRSALDRLDAGSIGLARLSAVLDLVAQDGGLRALWPVLLDLADAAAATSPKPAGLPDLLRLLTRLVVDVPDDAAVVPPAVSALASGRGSSKSQAEARVFVTAATSGRPA